MSRPTFLLCVLLASVSVFLSNVGFCGVSLVAADEDCPLISASQAARFGMERQWHTQVPLDSSNNRVTHLTLVPKSETSPDTLFVQTERSTLFAIDAETGKTLWSKLIGRSDLITGEVGCNGQMVAVLNGSKLFILNRVNGRVMWTRDFPGVPAAGPVLSQRYAYVPLLDGCVAAYPIQKIEKADGNSSQSGTDQTQATSDKVSNASALTLSQEKVDPLVCPSMYRIETQPVLIQDDAAADRLAWINEDGMYVGTISGANSQGFKLDYALPTSLSFAASPAFVPSRFTHPDAEKREQAAEDAGPFDEGNSVEDVPVFGALVAASTDGRVSAVQAGSGGILWGYHLGQPIVEPVIAIGARAYVVTQFGQLHCFDARTGKKFWETRDISQFVAQTSDRIYALDSSGEKVSVLRASNGQRIGKFPIAGFTRVVCNDKTDRLFFVTETGFIQSLRQRGVEEPLRHRE